MIRYTGFTYIDNKLKKMDKNNNVIIIQSKSINYAKLLGLSIAKNIMIKNTNSYLYYHTNSLSLDGYWLVNNQIKNVEFYNKIRILTNWNLTEKNEMFDGVFEGTNEITCLIEINSLYHLNKIESLITKEINKNGESDQNILFILCSKKIKLNENSAIDLIVEINPEYENANVFNAIPFNCSITFYNEINDVDNFKLLFTKDDLYNVVDEYFGDTFSINIRKINTLKSCGENVIIEAKILEIEKITLTHFYLYKLKVADESGIIYANMLIRPDENLPKLDIGKWYRIKGKIKYDSYANKYNLGNNNLVLVADDIEQI